MKNLTENDQVLLDPSKFHTKRTAYSDRTALLMAKLSSIAYTEFTENDYRKLVKELDDYGFELAGESPIIRGDTQAFVAVRREKTKQKVQGKVEFAVICFRGTEFTNIRDWITNFCISTVPIFDPEKKDKEIGRMHRGFHDAYQPVEGAIKGSVAYEIKVRLDKCMESDFLVTQLVSSGLPTVR